MAVVALMTDYGSEDHYAAALKGVIFGVCPSATVVDVTHDVPPQDILRGALILHDVWACFPSGTIFLAVVDPGVGTDRGILLGRYGGRFVVAPDNGLVAWVHHAQKPDLLYAVENHRYFRTPVSSTFHGRDIMAPVSAHLAAGVAPEAFGPPLSQPVLLDGPWAAEEVAEAKRKTIRGRVLYVDRFGTLVTNILQKRVLDRGEPRQSPRVWVNDECVGAIRSTFSDVAEGEIVALIGGGGRLEVAVNRGRAADRFGPAESLTVIVR